MARWGGDVEGFELDRIAPASTLAFLQYSRVGTTPSVGRGFTLSWHAASAAVVPAVHSPTRTSLRSAVKGASPCWRTTSVSTHVRTEQARQAEDSKAKPPYANETGGSWKKSPHSTS